MRVWRYLAILGIGHGVIVLCHAWVWAIAGGMSRYMPGERVGRVTKADLKAVGGMMGAWTVAWTVLAIAFSFR